MGLLKNISNGRFDVCPDQTTYTLSPPATCSPSDDSLMFLLISMAFLNDFPLSVEPLKNISLLFFPPPILSSHQTTYTLFSAGTTLVFSAPFFWR